MYGSANVPLPLPSVRDEYERVVADFEHIFGGSFNPLESYVVLLKGKPGCGKSFVIIYWARKYAQSGLRVMIMVPFRRLAIQMKQLFLDLGEPSENVMAIEGKSPILAGIDRKLIIICTYEHAYHIKQVLGFCNAVVIDEVHNLYYPERGWQLDPFLSTNHLLLCTGTITKKEMEDLRDVLIKRPPRSVARIFLDPNIARYSSILPLDKFTTCQADIMNEGGVFSFFAQKSSVVKAAYNYAKIMNMKLINPLSQDEMLSFPSCTELATSATQQGLLLDDIPDDLFRRKPTIYIDFSTHFSSRIRNLLSTDPDCKINVFCTTTLCEGLNLLSLKAVVIGSGQWDWRRIKQIEGRAGRFYREVPVYKGRIVPKNPLPLVLDLFDQIILEIRNELKDLRCYTKVSLEEKKIDEESYEKLISFLRRENYYSVQDWLHKNFGISPNVKFSSIERLQNLTGENKRKMSNPVIRAALNAQIDRPPNNNYISYFAPIFKVDYLDLSCLPEEDDE